MTKEARRIVAVRRDATKKVTHLILVSDGRRVALPVEEALRTEHPFYVVRSGEAMLVTLELAGSKLLITSPLKGAVDLPDES
jgi:CRP-like cAMP-binding protein